MAAKNLLAAWGVPQSARALAGAMDEIEQRWLVRDLIVGLARAGEGQGHR